MDDERDHQDKRWVAFLNYGTLLTDKGFNDLVCDLEERGVCVIPRLTGSTKGKLKWLYFKRATPLALAARVFATG